MRLTVRTLKRLIKEAVQEATQTPNESNVVIMEPTMQDGLIIHPPNGASVYIDQQMDDEHGEGASYDMEPERLALINQTVQDSGASFVYDADEPNAKIPWTTSDGENVKVWPVGEWLSMYSSTVVAPNPVPKGGSPRKKW